MSATRKKPVYTAEITNHGDVPAWRWELKAYGHRVATGYWRARLGHERGAEVVEL